MYDDNESPYRCPLCLVRPSLCTTDATTGKHTVGCLTSNCGAPVFTEPDFDFRLNYGSLKYVPLVKWDRWVVQYRNEHPNWHQEHVCDGCLKDWKTCGHYDADMVACPDTVCETEEEKE